MAFKGPYRSILKSKHFVALKKLRKNSEIVIIKLNKVPGAVIMDISDYTDKMLEILSDNKKFTPLDNPQDVIDVQREVDKMLKLLKRHMHL